MISGMDFADALHVAAAEDCAAFLSFDRKFAKSAPRQSSIEVLEP